MEKDISTTVVIIFLLIILLYIITIAVLGAKIQVQNKQLLGKDKRYLKLYDATVKDITKLQQKLISKENQIDKLEEVIHNLEKNKQYDNL